jgi:hypothetical protein
MKAVRMELGGAFDAGSVSGAAPARRAFAKGESPATPVAELQAARGYTLSHRGNPAWRQIHYTVHGLCANPFWAMIRARLSMQAISPALRGRITPWGIRNEIVRMTC